MIIYIIVALCLLSFALLSEFGYFKKSKVAKIVFLSIGSFILFVVSAFSVTIISDYLAYAKIFQSTINLSLEQLSVKPYEKGYCLLVRYIQLFSSHYLYFFIVASFFIILLLGIFLYKNSENPSLGLLIFYLFGYYFNSINYIRNVIAALIVLYAYKFICEKSFIRFIVLVLLASTFHVTALLFIPFYFIFKLKFNIFTIIGYTLVCSVSFYFSTELIKIFNVFYVYKNYDLYSQNFLIGTYIPYSIFFGLILLCSLLLKNSLIKYSKWSNVLIASTYVNFYLELLGTKHIILSRLALYFGPITAMLIVPNILKVSLKNIKNKSETNFFYRIVNYFCFSLTCFSAIGFFVYALYKNYNNVLPHQWIWDVYDGFYF